MSISLSLQTFGQEREYPKVGDICPDFSFEDVLYNKNRYISLKELKGQFVILDFWSVGCGACIKGFPLLNKIQNQYKTEITVILVGMHENNRNTKAFYEKYRKKHQLDLTVAFDSIESKKFVYGIIPHILLIDRNGIIKAITNSVSENMIERFVNDESFDFYDASYSGVKKRLTEVDQSKPLLINGNGGADTSYLFRSIIAKWSPGLGEPNYMDIEPFIFSNKGRYQTTAVSIANLYQLAYFGTTDVANNYPDSYDNPDIMAIDSSIFEVDFATGKGLYNYCIEVPSDKSTKEFIMKVMKNDLENYFALKGEIIEKALPCLKLIVSNKSRISQSNKLSNKYEVQWNKEFSDNFIKNASIKDLITSLKYGLSEKIPIFDYTGISNKVSIFVKGDIDDIYNLKRELRKNGLDLVSTTEILKVLRIRDFTSANPDVN